MTRSATTLTRQQRRLAELDERRYRQEGSPAESADQAAGRVTPIAQPRRPRPRAGRRGGLRGRDRAAAAGRDQRAAHHLPGQVADGLALGAANAPVTVELWSDFQCPACGLFTRTMEPSLVRDYVLPGKGAARLSRPLVPGERVRRRGYRRSRGSAEQPVLGVPRLPVRQSARRGTGRVQPTAPGSDCQHHRPRSRRIPRRPARSVDQTGSRRAADVGFCHGRRLRLRH